MSEINAYDNFFDMRVIQLMRINAYEYRLVCEKIELIS
jgi:hypothetical protein